MFTQEEILGYLHNHQISYKLYTHPPLISVQQGLEIIANLNIPGKIIKNLFLKDDHQHLYLISATIDTKIELKSFGKAIGVKNLRFADAVLLEQYLGVEPGSVTPLALINDAAHKVQFFLDDAILSQEYIQIHPLQNTATIVITPADLVKFLNLMKREYHTYNFAIKIDKSL